MNIILYILVCIGIGIVVGFYGCRLWLRRQNRKEIEHDLSNPLGWWDDEDESLAGDFRERYEKVKEEE